ncbi:MAG: exodeoxyribonuclease III [Chloroflexota bacterium]|nr:exodeoxyribonuclease III [Chloroflexota bacterium]
MKILSWNVNGIRAVERKGFLRWLYHELPDILCLQETKAYPDQLSQELQHPQGYHEYWNYPEKKGYSGVVTFAKELPPTVRYDLGIEEFDVEGRIIIAEYPQFALLNVYFPNGKRDETRLKYKLDFYELTFEVLEEIKAKNSKLIICGDFNTAHKKIDLADPKKNEKTSGFLPIERVWMDKLVAHGYVDAFRYFNKEPNQYTWWDLRTKARDRNIGWRLDYFFVSENLLSSVTRAFIMPQVMGSDHCPVGIELKDG